MESDLECIECNGNVRSAGSQQNQIQKPLRHLSDYVVFKSRLGGKLIYQRKLCFSKLSAIKAHIPNLNNLKQHMKRIIASKYLKFEEKVIAGSTRAVDSSDVDSSSSCNLFSPSSPNDSTALHLVGSNTFKKLIKTLNPSKN